MGGEGGACAPQGHAARTPPTKVLWQKYNARYLPRSEPVYRSQFIYYKKSPTDWSTLMNLKIAILALASLILLTPWVARADCVTIRHGNGSYTNCW